MPIRQKLDKAVKLARVAKPLRSLTTMSIDAVSSAGLLTISDVAELLKLSVSTIRRLQRQRKIPFVKVGRSVRFDRSDLTAYLEGRRVGAIGE
jgi:excisionase family DNA binding protein